jgi:hypothetical protein
MDEELKKPVDTMNVPRGGRYDDVNGVCEPSDDAPSCEDDEMSKLIASRTQRDVYVAVQGRDTGILNHEVSRFMQRGIWKG